MSLSQFISGWALLETSIGAISRLRAFVKETPVEAKESEDDETPPDWPYRGLIEIKNVTVHHR
jgi:ABC-type multidrug transport system fused ATPase/permease subunit